jgi:hypothetical protein
MNFDDSYHRNSQSNAVHYENNITHYEKAQNDSIDGFNINA